MPGKLFSGTTYTSGPRMSGNFNSDFIIKDVAKDIALLEPYNFPLISYLYLNNRKKWRTTANPLTKFEWGQDELIQNVDTVASYTSGAGGTSLVVTPTVIGLYHVGKRVRFEDIDQTGTVTAVSTTITVLCDGGANWDAGATALAATNILLLGEAMSENQDAPSAISTSKVMQYNYCQVFQKKISFTERLLMAAMNGGLYGGDDWEHQIKSRQLEMKRDIEMALWFNGAASLTTPATGEYRTTTAGIFYQVENGAGQIATFTGSLDEDELDAAVQKKKQGSNKATLFAGPDLARDIERIVKARYGNWGPVKKYGAIEGSDNVNVITYESMGKSIDIIRNPLFEGKYASWGVILDDEYVQPVSAANDDKGSRKMRLEVNVQTPGAPRKEAQYKADVGIQVKCAPAHVIIRPA